MSASRQFNRPLLNSSALASTHNSNTVANIFTTGGNVGIGTTAPAYKLDVMGTYYSKLVALLTADIKELKQEFDKYKQSYP